MISLLLSGFALVHIALFVWSFSWQSHAPWRQWFLRIMLLAMAFDNATVALAPYLLGSARYFAANTLRYVMHAAVLPFLTLFALSILQDSGYRPAQARPIVLFCLLFTALAVTYGLWHDVYLHNLAAQEVLGFERLTSTSTLPPIATILTNLLILPMAALVWRASGWYVFFIAALFIFVLNGATGAQAWGFLVGNAAELVFILCLLCTERHFAAGTITSTPKPIK